MKLPEGKPLTLEEAELFIKSREERNKFKGAIKMKGKTADKTYSLELVMRDGAIAVMEVDEGGKTTAGDKALEEVKKFGGSEGDLKLLRFNTQESENAIKDNPEAVLQKRIVLEEFRIRIRPATQKEEASEKKGMLNAVKVLLSPGAGPPLKKEFKGQFKLEFKEEPEKKEGGFDVKQALIARIKDRRFGRLTEKLLAKRREKRTEDKEIVEGEVVETSIDKLFNLIDKRNKVKINENLAKELGVSKQRIEEWAVILEEHNLVTINYPPLGEPEITRKERK